MSSLVHGTGEAAEHYADAGEVLRKAVLNAGHEMGLSQARIGEIIGRDRSSLKRRLNPATKPGELALLLIRVYRALYALMGGNAEHIRHWLHTDNLHTGGVPAEQLRQVQGLTRVLDYLDAMRGRA